MTLWALRVAVLGDGPWLVIRNEKNLDRLRNTPRQRGLTSDALNRGVHEFLTASLILTPMSRLLPSHTTGQGA